MADVYELSAVGGFAHMVIDDMNVDNSHIDWCIKYAAACADEDPELSSRSLKALKALRHLRRRWRITAIEVAEQMAA